MNIKDMYEYCIGMLRDNGEMQIELINILLFEMDKAFN